MNVLLVCSGGGHLKQLHLLLPRFGIRTDRIVWATFDTALSRSLLADQEVVYLPYAAPRDAVGTLRNSWLALHLLRSHGITDVISTGANPALSAMIPARLLGKSCHFIESATRCRAPSMTGTILARLPGVQLYTQSQAWASERWRYVGSIFDSFSAGRSREAPGPIRRVVVTVGTTESYGFRSLFQRLLQILPAGLDVLWQTGATDVNGLGIVATERLPAPQLRAAIRAADVVVAHAGTGSALEALEAGRCPVLVPRRASRQEHVDDHQLETATELEHRGLAVHRDVEALRLDDLVEAARRRVEVVPDPPLIKLVGLQPQERRGSKAPPACTTT